MDFFVISTSIIFTVFSTAIITYISIATMVGPWIAPIIVLMSSALLKIFKKSLQDTQKHIDLALIQTVGSVGGIIGMGIGFSLPTLYFLDPVLFNNWLKKPFFFCSIISAISLIAGGLGIWLARCFAEKFINQEKLSFPVSQLIYKTITSQTQEKQAKNMLIGFSSSWIICFLRDGIFKFKGILSKVYYIFPNLLGSEFAIAVSPMLWAIGFIVGIKIVLPLLIGMLSKYFIVYPLNYHSNFLPFSFFAPLSTQDFITAFCSGIVLAELILSLTKYPNIFWNKIKEFSGYKFFEQIKNVKNNFSLKKTTPSSIFTNLEPSILLLLSTALLYYLGFSFIAIAFLLVFTIIFTYQLSYLGGKIGLITFGRFATFIMIPMMLLFKIDFVQITLLCVFFNVCAGAASDMLFDYKVGELCNISFKKIQRYQWLGLIVTSLCVGIFLWLLFSNLQIGSPDLFAQRGKSRALLIQSLSFNWFILFLGFLYGVILKKLKINPTMVFGGLLMPNDLTIGLVIGAVISWVSKNKTEQEPIWSGIFAGESLWILFSILLKMIG